MIVPTLYRICGQHGQRAATEQELVRELREVGIDFVSLRDGWGMPYRLVFVSGKILVVSNGADKTPNTKDDSVAERFPCP